VGDKAYILGVDDEPVNQVILEELLGEQYELICVDNGRACLDAVKERKPDLILLDINMPLMNGLDTCIALREVPEYKQLPIIFVSALASYDERMAGYDAGGDDYITKPFNERELLIKINLMLENTQEKAQLKDMSDFASKTAMTAMTSTSELGLVLRFLQESFSCNSYQEVAQKAFECSLAYGLSATLVVYKGEGGERVGVFTSDTKHRPLEATVLEQLRDKGRIYTINEKVIYNGRLVSLLTKDNPIGDEDRFGRIKDNIAILVDGIDARIRAINTQLALVDTIEIAQTEMQDLDLEQRRIQGNVAQELSHLAGEIEASFMNLGLTAEQETALMTLVNQAEKNTDAMHAEGVAMDERFGLIISQLKQAIGE